MEFTTKELVELLGITKQKIGTALKYIHYELKEVDGSSKKVKHYKLDDLPQRYIEKLKQKGIEDKKEDKKAPAPFTQKYLLAHPEKQKKALAKCKLVEWYFARDGTLNQTKWLEKIQTDSLEFDCLGGVSPKQLNDWVAKYKEAKAKGANIVEEFIDARGGKKKTTALTKEQQEMAVRFFLKDSHPIITNIHFLMCEHFGKEMASYDALNNFYNNWKKENPQLYTFSKSPDKWKNNYMVALGDESAKATHRNHFWEFDATPADVICSDGKRYTILGLIDIDTRRPIFTVEESNSSFAVSRLLRKGILKFGIPENIVIDNGKEFVSNHFESICRNLEIEVKITPPFSGDKKPFIERMFGTLARGLFRQLHGFIGHNVAMKDDIQARKSFGHKIMAQRKAKSELDEEEENAFAKLWMIKKENVGIDIEFALSKLQLQSAIDTWVEKYYEQKVHKKLNTTPIKKWNKYTTPVQSISDESMLDLLLGQSIKRVVRKKGIEYGGCCYWHDELLKWMGKSVKIMTREDMGKVVVYDMDSMKLICEAIDYEKLGLSREMAFNAKKEQKKVLQQMNKAVKLAENADDPTLLEILETKTIEAKANTIATTKHTKVTDMLLNESKTLEELDKKELEASKNYDFKDKDENGKPKKVLKGGREVFKSYTDKFVWCLENDIWSKKDLELKKKRPKSFEMAKKIYEERKTA